VNPWLVDFKKGLRLLALSSLLSYRYLVLLLLFLTFYFEHLKTSESVDASLTFAGPKLDDESKLESILFDLLLVNKGDHVVTVSGLGFGFDASTNSCCGSRTAITGNGNAAAPILIPSMQAIKVPIGFKFQGLLPGSPGFLPAPYNFRIVEKGEGSVSRQSAPPPPPIIIEKLTITLGVTTIAASYDSQDTSIPVGILYIKDGTWSAYTPNPLSYELRPIRKDPPFFKSIWHSLTN
jgi:hypothetical protein